MYEVFQILINIFLTKMLSIKIKSPKEIIHFLVRIYKSKRYIYGGQIFFLIGISLLPSALPISIFFLLISTFIALTQNGQKYFLDKWNIYLLLLSFLMILSYVYKVFTINDDTIIHLIKGSWVDLFNWLPLFLIFYAFQSYLANSKQRILFCKALLIGSIPVIFSCITQYWFKLYGPFSTFFGLITWYQKPFENNESGITGLFNNPNYTSYWLATILPFAIFFLLKNKTKKYKFLVFLTNSFLIFYLLILTSSRNGLFSFSISTLLVFSSKLIFSIFLLIFTILLIISLFKSFLPIHMISIIDNIFPAKLITKSFSISQFNLNYLHRFDTYKNTILFIFEKPLFGWGASTFTILYFLKSKISITTHTHNIFLEVAYNYGILVSLFFTLFVLQLIIKSYKLIKIRNRNDLYDINKFWLTSSLCSIIFHLNDIPYYDGKVNLLFWTLLSGLKCILDEDKKMNIQEVSGYK